MSRNNDAPQMRLWRLGSLKNSQISNGTADIGRAIFQLIAAPPSAVNMSGAVSPTTREMASRIPVNILPNADGTMT